MPTTPVSGVNLGGPANVTLGGGGPNNPYIQPGGSPVIQVGGNQTAQPTGSSYPGGGGYEDDWWSWHGWPWGGGDGGYGGGDDDYYGTGGSGGFFGGGGSGTAILGGVAAGAALGSLNRSSGNASSVQRNLPQEIGQVLNLAPGAAASTVGTNLQLNPLLTALNTANFGYAANQVAGSMRNAYDAANPALAAYTGTLGDTLGRLNGLGAPRYDPTGYAAQISDSVLLDPARQAATERARFTSAGPAAQATFSPAQAHTAALMQAQAEQARQQRATGGTLLGTLESQAMRSVGGVSALQDRQQQIALGLLGGSGGDLTGQDLRNIQQDTRGAFAARGLYDSNQAIGAEIMNSDAARRARLVQNLGIAQGVDAAGQQQIGATRNFALGVQNQGQNLSQFNASQGNALGQFNTGQVNDTSRFNAAQGNDVGKFNAGLLTQNAQFNSQGALQASLANMQARNSMAQFDATGRNQTSQFNAGLGTSNNQWNAGAANQLGLAGANLLQNNLQFNAGQLNNAQGFSANAVNASNQWNAGMQQQNANDQWARALQFGNFQQQGALNPTATAMGLIGNAPDYTANLLGYGSDVYSSNSNAQAAANNSRANNNAALTAAGINLLGTIYGSTRGPG